MTTAVVGAPGSARRYLHSLWLLSARDLKVRYATSALGYLWSILDPLVMSAIYWFVFTLIFQRDGIGGEPYIVFLLVGLLPWVWFNASVIDFTKAFRKDAKLVRSTAIPRSIWVGRIVLSKGIEFLFSIPVLILFALFAQPRVQWNPLILLFPLGIVLQAVLLVGLGLLLGSPSWIVLLAIVVALEQKNYTRAMAANCGSRQGVTAMMAISART